MRGYQLPEGVHRVERKLADGRSRFHFYAERGNKHSKFWSGYVRCPVDLEFRQAWTAKISRPKPIGISTSTVIDRFLSSAEFVVAIRPRTQSDYRGWLKKFDASFGEDSIKLFEEPESRGEVNTWRQKWMHSPKQYDYAGTVVCRFLNWAKDEAKVITKHHCEGFKKLYQVDRSKVIWTPSLVDQFCKDAPVWTKRILIAACETGLRPADLCRLNLRHVEPTPKGRRITITTNKSNRTVFIPVTEAMADLIDSTPECQKFILVGLSGKPLDERRISEAVFEHRKKAKIEGDVRLYDARGTAATRLLHAGLSLNQIAGVMGWGLRYAANMIEKYAEISGSESDAILELLEEAKHAPDVEV
ncbi:tyrosine-type recombinase/integrase [Yoonia sediminilitoris]|uniref:Phage integrase family protein n=1 Tax=Yoonia sediminilitoris TaxID=1286148 RepID=A0A2T6KEZ0_9RHOB|nr:site-specific integrase [Yoonia sediminilitoris]PUB13694.1 phage integrase family protein [Yoonia sediminilitoris]RCW94864.1 phage integrase family protein [Yoonia sediminilitoris]